MAYTYDATGCKLKVVHSKSGKTHTMEYIGSHIYEDGTLKQSLIEGGYLTYSGSTPVYHFYVNDHLGNNRMVLSEKGAVEQVTHYYPYGMAFAEGSGADVQRFKYNGKELDAEDGLNWMDYGARMYDAAIARWGGVDALAEKYRGLSVYGYCGENPITYVDVDGREILTSFNTSVKKGDSISNIKRAQSNVRLENSMKNHIVDHEDIIFFGAHGAPSFIELKDGYIKSSSSMRNYLDNNSMVWKSDQQAKRSSVIVLYSCSTGEGDKSIAQQISKDLESLVIAPDATLHMNPSTGKCEVYDSFLDGGHWNIFYNGELKEQLNGADPILWGENAVQLNEYLKDKTAEQLINIYSNGQ